MSAPLATCVHCGREPDFECRGHFARDLRELRARAEAADSRVLELERERDHAQHASRVAVALRDNGYALLRQTGTARADLAAAQRENGMLVEALFNATTKREAAESERDRLAQDRDRLRRLLRDLDGWVDGQGVDRVSPLAKVALKNTIAGALNGDGT